MVIRKHFSLLGCKAKDKVTGFVGIVESVSFDLYGCVQAVIRPPMDKKGDLPDGRWFDVARLAILSKTPVMRLPDFEWGAQAEGRQGAAEKSVRRDSYACSV